ncbi:2CS histidine protein kinase [Bifidobacterium miconisargentati]|uniref:2CS histidine protein kinase n=1 Tax=Bifidobacterium miconisargentati TaxID=2834437 RepID=UPI001BDDB593|nr:2CS histidine protein kinase [Bifidobacterium miconisargentati]MBW3090376.1 2CS histidine protein kinase [Bifidobacterium miconisargentati]
MYELRHSIDAIDDRVRNAWLLVAVLVTALVCSAETLGGILNGDMTITDAITSFVFVVAVILMAFRPVTGCVLTGMAWTVLCLAAAQMPSATLLSVLLAVGIAGYADRRLALAITAVAMLAWFVGNANLSGTRLLFGTIAIRGVMPVIVLFLGFLLGGVAARWNHERSMAQAELDHRKRQERAARDIHDYVSNDLAYLILRFDKDIADGNAPSTEELRELCRVAAEALERTHQVISVIEGRDAAQSSCESAVGMRNAGLSQVGVRKQADCPLAEQVRSIAATGDRRLRELGFEGQTIITDAGTTADCSVLVAGLLEELYGNVAKHADPAQGYVMTVGIGTDAVRVVCTDTPKAMGTAGDMDDAALSSGTGLNRYRRLLEQQNGVLHIEMQDAEWTLSAVIPLTTH